MMKDTKETVLKMMDKFDDTNLQGEVNKIIMDDPILELKNTVLEFFTFRLKKIKDQESFKQQIQHSILEKIEQGGMSDNQLINLYKIAGEETTTAVDSLFSLFRSNVGSSSIFEDKERKKIEETNEKVLDAFSNLTPPQMEKIDKFMRVFSAIVENNTDNSGE